MGLSTELISEFVKITNDTKKGKKDNTVYGTVSTVSEDGKSGTVIIDGSDEATPVTTTCMMHEGDRVRLNVRNHNAIVTGNMSSPAFGLQEANGLRSEISQTLSEIRLEVGDTVSGLEASVALTVNEIRSEVSNTLSGWDTRITQTENAITSLAKGPEGYSELKQTFDALTFITENGTVKLSGGNIKLTGSISFGDIDGADDVLSDIEDAYDYAEDAFDYAYDAYDTVDGWRHSSNGTYIDGSMIYSDSIYASAIHLGGWMNVYKTKTGSTIGGYIGYDSGFNSTYGIGMQAYNSYAECVCTDEAARLSWGQGASFVANSDNYAYIDGSVIVFEIGGDPYICLTDHSDYGSLRPYSTSYTMHLGKASHRWGGVYATNGEIQTSDRNYKHDIEHIPDKYIILFDHLIPRRFKMNEGSSGRYHVGYIAQEVEEAMLKVGIDSLEFGGFVRDIDEEGREICMLRYGEFDAIRDLKIKKIETDFTMEITQLKAELAAIKEVINK